MVGIPSVGKISRGICFSPSTAPKAMPNMSTTTVKGRRSAARTKFMLEFGISFALFAALRLSHHFFVKLFDSVAKHFQHLFAFSRQPVVLPRPPAPVRIAFALQPAQPFHPMQHGIQCPGADLIAMTAQLEYQPLPMQWL